MRAEFASDARYNKWFRNQMQLQTRRHQQQQQYTEYENQYNSTTGQQLFGVPNDGITSENNERNS